MLWALGIVAGAIVASVYTGYRTRQSWRTRSALANASEASAGSLRAGQGAVELNGTAEAAEHTFQSPLTDQTCVAYRFRKEEKQRKRTTDHSRDGRRKTTYEWVTIHEEEGGAPFYLDDGTGHVLVDGSTADLDMKRSYEVGTEDVERGIGERAVASVKGLVGSEPDTDGPEIPEQYVSELRNTSNRRRYKEWVVHEGEEVYAYGEAVSTDRTPLGSGVRGDLSAATTAFQAGIVGMLKALVGFGKEAATDPQTRYKPRAIKRLSDTTPEQGPADTDRGQLADLKSQSESLAEQAQQMQGQNPAAAQDMMRQFSEMLEGAGNAVEERLPETPALDAERVVVSWGEQVPTFVVSDQGKDVVLREHSTGTARYAVLTIAAVAVAVGSLAFALGIV